MLPDHAAKTIRDRFFSSKPVLRAIAGMALVCAAGAVSAQPGFPSKPIRLILGFAPGGATDLIARSLGSGLGAALGQPIVVENKAGAGGLIANEYVAKAAPDGYTLLLGSAAAFSILPHLTAKLPYDPDKDFAAVAPFARISSVLIVNASLPVTSIRELVAYAKQRPDSLNYASNGNGGMLHIGMEIFLSMAGIRMTHVPYNNLGLAMQHIVSGEIQAMLISPVLAMSQVRSGRVRALGISTARRSEYVPDIPSIDEAGVKGYNSYTWFGVFAPAGTPHPIIERLNAAINSVSGQADMIEQLRKDAAERFPGTPEDLATLVRVELDMYGKVIRQIGLQKQ